MAMPLQHPPEQPQALLQQVQAQLQRDPHVTVTQSSAPQGPPLWPPPPHASTQRSMITQAPQRHANAMAPTSSSPLRLEHEHSASAAQRFAAAEDEEEWKSFLAADPRSRLGDASIGVMDILPDFGAQPSAPAASQQDPRRLEAPDAWLNHHPQGSTWSDDLWSFPSHSAQLRSGYPPSMNPPMAMCI